MKLDPFIFARSNMKNNLLKGNSRDVIDTNVRTLMHNGYSQAKATKVALCCANKSKAGHKAAHKVARSPKATTLQVK